MSKQNEKILDAAVCAVIDLQRYTPQDEVSRREVEQYVGPSVCGRLVTMKLKSGYEVVYTIEVVKTKKKK